MSPILSGNTPWLPADFIATVGIRKSLSNLKLLNDISYFRLIKAYSLGFKPKNGKYEKVDVKTMGFPDDWKKLLEQK